MLTLLIAASAFCLAVTIASFLAMLWDGEPEAEPEVSLPLVSMPFGMQPVPVYEPRPRSPLPIERKLAAQAMMSRFAQRAIPRVSKPRTHEHPCAACNAVALAWHQDSRRGAWIGTCRRCGLARLDVVGEQRLEV